MTLTEAVLALKADTLGVRDRAELEALIWGMASPEDRKRGTGIRDYIVSRYGGTVGGVERRHALHLANIPELWDAIETKTLSLRHAYALYHKARGPRGERRSPGGVRQHVRDLLNPQISSPHREPEPKQREEKEHEGEKALRRDVLDRLGCFLDAALGRELDAEHDKARAEALTEVSLALAAVFRICEHALTPALAEGPSRREIIAACRHLGLNLPGRTGVDLPAAKKALRALVRSYHPDHREGNHDKQEALNRALDAYRVLENSALYKKETISHANGDPHV
jgi:DnaJ-domain-containing protein 1